MLDGINLDQLIEADGPQPPARGVRILQQVSGALSEAHGIGLVHRDIKPGNVVLYERGGEPDVAKVVDFGLVKRFLHNETDATMAATTVQTLLGTPLYMAPESIAGSGDIDARGDLAEAVAYLLLTGTPVFQAASVVKVLATITGTGAAVAAPRAAAARRARRRSCCSASPNRPTTGRRARDAARAPGHPRRPATPGRKTTARWSLGSAAPKRWAEQPAALTAP